MDSQREDTLQFPARGGKSPSFISRLLFLYAPIFFLRHGLCYYSFRWLEPLLFRGYREELRHEDLLPIPSTMASQSLLKKFNRCSWALVVHLGVDLCLFFELLRCSAGNRHSLWWLRSKQSVKATSLVPFEILQFTRLDLLIFGHVFYMHKWIWLRYDHCYKLIIFDDSAKQDSFGYDWISTI